MDQADDDEFVTAQRAQSTAAELQYERTASLVQDGILARSKLDAAAAAAQTAAQKLREREKLIQETKAGSDAMAQAKSAVARDEERAKAERTAELTELAARRSELRTSLLQLHLERSVMAPVGGTVVYRHPSPALAEDDQVILALAKGAGFMATVQLPAREAAMLTGSLYAVAHRDHICLSLLSPFFDFYQGILLNCAWVIAIFDEARGARMRW
jgi:hypothetical protein